MSHVILLVGVDGSGKSTLSTMLKNELDRRGIKNSLVWASHRPFLLKPFIVIAKYLLVRKHDKFEDWDKHIAAKKSGMRKLAFLRPLYFLVTLIDYVPQVIWKVWLPRLRGKVVICDRYYHDLVLDFGVTSVLPIESTIRMLRWADACFPRPDLLYWIDVPADVAYARKSDIPSPAYLQERAEIYRRFIEVLRGQTLDGTRSLSANLDRLVADTLALPALHSEGELDHSDR